MNGKLLYLNDQDIVYQKNSPRHPFTITEAIDNTDLEKLINEIIKASQGEEENLIANYDAIIRIMSDAMKNGITVNDIQNAITHTNMSNSGKSVLIGIADDAKQEIILQKKYS
mgnify:CR=1 FL=1